MEEENKKLNILFLPTHGWYPDEENPHTALFVKEHAKAAALYHDITIIYSNLAEKGTKGLYEIYSDKEEEGIRTIRIRHRECGMPNIIYRRSISAAFKKLLIEGWKPDIINVHVFLAGVTAAALKKRFGIPYVISEHWTAFDRRTLSGKDLLKAQFAMNNAALILPVSKSLQDAISSHGIKNRQEVVPNVVDMNLFYPDANPKKSGEKMLLCVATLLPKKGINYLLKAIARLKLKRDDFKLDIIGDGKNGTELKKQASNSGLNGTVTFHGSKPKEDVAKFMRSCTFYVQPSLHETFGITYYEAMACGKPVVASQIPVLQEKIDQNKGILVPPKDVDALTEAIDYMLDHYQDYSSQNISQYVQDNFSHEKVGKQLDRIYRGIAEC